MSPHGLKGIERKVEGQKVAKLVCRLGRNIQLILRLSSYGVGKWTLAIFYRCKRNGRVAINVAVEVVDDGETEGSRIVTWSFLKECDLGPIGALSIHLGGFNGRGDGEVVREGKVVDAWAQPGSAVVGAHNALVTFIFRVDPDVMPGTDVGFESPKIKLLESGNSVVSVSLGGDGAGGKGSILGSGEGRSNRVKEGESARVNFETHATRRRWNARHRFSRVQNDGQG